MSKKRGQGEGSIYQDPKGSWCAAISLGWQINDKGKAVWKRRILKAPTRAQVQQKLTKELRDRDRGLSIEPARHTVGSFLNAWLADTVKNSVRPKTYRSYEQMVRNHLAKDIPTEEWKKRKLDDVLGLGRLPLSKLSLAKIQRFFTEKLDAGNSPALVSYLRVVLRIALGEAVKAQLIPQNWAELSTPPRVERRKITPLTPEQALTLLKAAQGHRLEALFSVGVAIGLRSGEVSALRWQDIDFATGRLHVRHTLQRMKGQGLQLYAPKSEKSKRIVELPDVCLTALKAHRRRQQSEREWAGTGWHDTGHVFTSTIGTPVDDRMVLSEFTDLLAVAKLPRIRFHDLRHTCVSLLKAQGVSDKVIAEIVGHSDIRLTQQVYQHVYEPAKKDAAMKMDSLLNPVATPVATLKPSKPVN